MIILGIESSCDETAAALIEVKGGKFNILSSTVFSQIDIHKQYGGVVPEIAARNHVINFIPCVDQTLAKAKIKPQDIDKIAVTTGPGLITSLIVGIETAKSLAYAWQKPIVGINHLKAHLYANFLSNQKIIFPAIALIVSGGHTELILMKDKTNFKKIGQTIDDAAGEAFDKVAQLLDLDYPGGPIISKLAEKGNTTAFDLPRPMMHDKNYNFSFSGLKTAVLYTVQKIKKIDQKAKQDLSASFEQAVVDVLIHKTKKAAQEHQAKSLLIAGGVAANKKLRTQFEELAKELNTKFFMPDFSLCTDNAVMIAGAAYFEKNSDWGKIKADPNLAV